MKPALANRRVLVWILGIVALLAALVFLQGVYGPHPDRAWQIFLVNFLFWTGISQGGAVFLAILYVTRAGWAESLKPVAARMAAFLPVSFLLFLVLYLGRENLFRWIVVPVPGKELWLNVPFFFLRDGIALFLLVAGSLLLVSSEKGKNLLFSSFFLLLYVLVYSLLGFDLVMSLDPHWYSTLFGGYFFMSSFYMGLAGLSVLAALDRKSYEIGSRQFHDLGKLVFAFCILTADFLWSQFAVIWYGNIPEETEYVIRRGLEVPWEPIAWGVLVVAFAVPFIVFLSRAAKENPGSSLVVASIVLIGMWFERYLLVVPSIWREEILPLGWPELVITLGFIALFALSYVVLGPRYARRSRILAK